MAKGVIAKSTKHIREMIKVEELIMLLQDSALRKNGRPLNPQKLKQIEILLKKALPDLRAVEHTGNVDTEISFSWGKPKE